MTRMPPEDRPTEPPPPPDAERRERTRSWEWTLVHRSRAPANASFWTTGAGIVTALATLVTAAAGLIVALGQVGVIGGSGSSSGKPPAPPTEVASTDAASTVVASGGSDAAEQRLLARIPAEIRDSCGTTAYHGDRSIAAVDCTPEGVDEVHYELYANAGDVAAHYRDRARTLSTGGDCASGQPGERAYGAGEGAGRVFCYVSDGKAWIEWFRPAPRVYAYVEGNDADLRKLAVWWRDVPGPLPG